MGALPTTTTKKIDRKGGISFVTAAILAIALIVVMAIMYNTQFFAPIAKKTGFLNKVFETDSPKTTDFPIEEYRVKAKEALAGGVDTVLLQFVMTVDVGFSREQRTLDREYVSWAALLNGQQTIDIERVWPNADEIESLDAIIFYFTKQGMETPYEAVYPWPAVGDPMTLSIPLTTPEGEVKKDVNDFALTQPVALLTVESISDNTLLYSVQPFVEEVILS